MAKSGLTTELFIKNRSKLISGFGDNDCCIVFSNDEMPRNGDQYFPYRQSSDFYYLTGIEQEKSILILAPGHPEKKLREVLLILESNPMIETWVGHKLTIDEARELSGIQNVIFLGTYENTLNNLMRGVQTVFLNIPEIPKFNPEIVTRDVRLSKQLQDKYPLHRYERLAPHLMKLRMVKEPEEIETIQIACNITRDAFNRVLKMIRPGIYEKEIEAEISYEFHRQGATHAYPPIVGSGKNACILHYTVNNQVCRDGDLVLMDFGAEFSNYAADCTRTIPVNGKFTERQAEIYDRLHLIFKNAIKLMEPGRTMEEVHKNICREMQEFHIDIGLYTRKELKGSDPASPLWFKYYMHGSGHSIGLDVHDIYDKEAKFSPGMVFTCEPAIYIADEGLGIRIENDILITLEGNLDLMAGIASERSEIEKLML